MRQNALSGWFSAMLVVVLWRGLSELVQRQRQLAASGLLARRVGVRRASRVDRALGRHDLAPATGVPGRVRVCASVRVDSVSAKDFDDVALLEGAMRRAARDRVDRGSFPCDRTGWGFLADQASQVRLHAGAIARDTEQAARWWLMPIALAGAAATFVAILRPLADAAPVIAGAGIAMVLASWLVSLRR